MQHNLETPVLFLIFNRPETTQVVFDEIRKARPLQLFVAADGPRMEKPEDREKCRKAREIIRQVDWDCTVSTLFRDENLGCKHAISSAIDWFFSHVEEGIILEDDCVPDQSFFPFCHALLGRYRNDERVMMIAGSNYQFSSDETDKSFYFSRYYAIWGWATWKRAWSLYDVRMQDWPLYNSRKYLHEIYRDKRIVSFFQKLMQETYDNDLDTWDVQWGYTCIFNHGLSITPAQNLISNIGNTGIHTKEPGPFHNLSRKTIDVFNLRYPEKVIPDFRKDTRTFDAIFNDETFFKQILGIAYTFKKKLMNRKKH